MGQYYKAIFLNEDNKPISFVSSYDFDNGAKLMEHSWIGNKFVEFVEYQLFLEPKKLVWAGDYADHEPIKTITKDEFNFFINNDSVYYNKKALKKNSLSLYDLSDMYFKLMKNKDDRIDSKSFKYLINYDTKEYVDKSKVPYSNADWMNGRSMQIHPLSLLTCEGNGRGNGDYCIDKDKKQGNVDLIGSWARNKIGIVPNKKEIPKGFKELIFDLIEE